MDRPVKQLLGLTASQVTDIMNQFDTFRGSIASARTGTRMLGSDSGLSSTVNRELLFLLKVMLQRNLVWRNTRHS